MTARKPLIAANWKMHPAPSALDSYKGRDNVDVVVFPTFLDVHTCMAAGLVTGAQYGHAEDTGAHTGDVSMKMLAELGVTHVLCGHSERRQNHHESNEDVAEQVVAALQHNLHPILCVGETEAERKAGKEKEVVQTQLQAVISRIPDPGSRIPIIAYEPVWAIGTGKTATPEDAQQMHSFLRNILSESLIPDPDSLRILYGGSMKPENAAELLAQPDIDGGLVGGASLKPEQFAKIVEAAIEK